MMQRMISKIKDIATYFPAQTLDNAALAELYPGWPAEKIYEKTGIRQRHIAAVDETATDLAYGAAQKLFSQGVVAAENVDFLILCTQAPDHVLPTSACLLQERLGLRTSVGALDINLGCSGFVYGLSLAKGLIESGSARCVLLLTADTYSKYINPMDKSVRTLFGDAAAATAIVGVEAGADGRGGIGPFVFGTDGHGARNLIVEAGLFRTPRSDQTAKEYVDDSGNVRSQNDLYMNGAEVMAFSLKEVPKAAALLLERAGISMEAVDYVVLHQANKFMLEALRRKMKLAEAKVPILVENCGNTVSSTIPIALHTMFVESGVPRRGVRMMLVGFGVGYSWAACLVDF